MQRNAGKGCSVESSDAGRWVEGRYSEVRRRPCIALLTRTYYRDAGRLSTRLRWRGHQFSMSRGADVHPVLTLVSLPLTGRLTLWA